MIQRNLHINKRAHSTETAFVRISNDILQANEAIDNKCMTLASLDLSAAFDTVDHGTLVYRPKIYTVLVITHYAGLHPTWKIDQLMSVPMDLSPTRILL